MIFVGFFEGLASQRMIAWRCAGSLSLKAFLGYALTEETPDHSSLGSRSKVADAGGSVQLGDGLQGSAKARELVGSLAVVALGELEVPQDQFSDRQVGIMDAGSCIIHGRSRVSGEFGDEPGIPLPARRGVIRAKVDVSALA